MKAGYRYSLPAALLLLPFLYAMFFAFPLGDDFGRAVSAAGLFDVLGGLRDLGLHWLYWSGRYTHHFLVIFLGDAVLTRSGYGLVCVAVFLLYGIALHGIFGQLAPAARPRDRAFLTLLSLLALAAGHRALNISYYLVTDALGLGIGNAMVLMFVFALCRLWFLPAPRRRDAAFAVFCAAFAIGCYEHAALATFTAAALAAWMAWRCRHPQRAVFLLIAGAALLFLLLSFLAPGNFNRQRVRDVTRATMLAQLWLAGRDWAGIVLQALAGHFALLAAFLGLAVAPRRRGDVRALPPGEMAVAGAFAFVALSAGIVLVHALSDVRVIATPKLPASMHLLLGMVLAYVAIACAGRLRALAADVPAYALAAPLIAVLALSANTTGTLRSIASGELDEFAATMQRRIDVLAAARGEDVRLAPLRACPFPACTFDPVPASAAAWPAAHIARYYGQRSVLTADTDPARAVAFMLGDPTVTWTRLPGDHYEAATTEIDPGPNATYREAWLFVRGGAAPAVSVLIERTGSLFERPRPLRLAPMPGQPSIQAAALGPAAPGEQVLVSLEGGPFHRLGAVAR